MVEKNIKRVGAPKKPKTKPVSIRYNSERWDQLAKDYKGSLNKLVSEYLDSLPKIKKS